jgi:hypothetical protein
VIVISGSGPFPVDFDIEAPGPLGISTILISAEYVSKDGSGGDAISLSLEVLGKQVRMQINILFVFAVRL